MLVVGIEKVKQRERPSSEFASIMERHVAQAACVDFSTSALAESSESVRSRRSLRIFAEVSALGQNNPATLPVSSSMGL